MWTHYKWFSVHPFGLPVEKKYTYSRSERLVRMEGRGNRMFPAHSEYCSGVLPRKREREKGDRIYRGPPLSFHNSKIAA